MDSLKKRGRETAEEDEKLEFLIDSSAHVETTDIDFVERTMGMLSPIEREIVSLYVFVGLRHTEIATVVDLPYTKVRATYAYALKKMRKALEEGQI